MALSELEQKQIEKAVFRFSEQRRPAAEMRAQYDLGYRIVDQGAELFEIRPRWDKPEEKIESAIAKATWVKSREAWKVFWRRADLKWHGYPPTPEVKMIEQFLAVVARDEHGRFLG